MNVFRTFFSRTWRKFYKIVRWAFKNFEAVKFIVKYFMLVYTIGEDLEGKGLDGAEKYEMMLSGMLDAIEKDKNQGEYKLNWLNSLIDFVCQIVS